MKSFDPIPQVVDQVAHEIVDAAFAVHTALGPGLLESVYETCLCRELAGRDIKFRTQVTLPIEYKGVRLESGLRLDLVVAESVIVELKAVEKMLPVFEAQLLTYLRLAGMRLGLLINFNVPLLKTGIKRIVL
ncbi:MAG TPA: GxxExxY protein [Candidatus Binataceae bacterium]|nr:GxxExxY protein [Candidatus Binataceae bacterium]